MGGGALRLLHALDRQAAALHPADPAAAGAAHGPNDALPAASTRRTQWRLLPAPRQRNLALAICASCTAVGLIVLAVLLYRARPLLFALSPTNGLIGTAVIVTASVGLLAVAWFGRYSLLPAALAAASVATLLALNYSVYSAAGLEPVQRMARLYARERQNNEPSATYKAFVRNLVFYTNVKQTNLIDDREAIEYSEATGARVVRAAGGRAPSARKPARPEGEAAGVGHLLQSVGRPPAHAALPRA